MTWRFALPHRFNWLAFLLSFAPDVKNISDPAAITTYQNSVLESFSRYSSEHSPHIPSKVPNLIVRLADLSRLSAVAKETLVARQQTGRVPQHSLLHELLKGDAELH